MVDEKILNGFIEEAKPHSDSKGDHTMLWTVAEYASKTPVLDDQPPFLEIGTRAGGSALLLLRIIEEICEDSVLVNVDPYGSKPYDDKQWVYGEDFYIDMKKLLSPFGNHIHYKMTSEQFISIMDDISYWYSGEERTLDRFSFIFLDGSHEPETVRHEFKHLFPKLIQKGFMVVDNTDFYKGEMKRYFQNLERDDAEVITKKHQTIIQKIRV